MIHEERVRQYLKNNPQRLVVFWEELRRPLTVGKEITNLSFCTHGTVTAVYCIPLLVGAEDRSNAAKEKRQSRLRPIHFDLQTCSDEFPWPQLNSLVQSDLSTVEWHSPWLRPWPASAHWS